jgi:hypothetical protein
MNRRPLAQLAERWQAEALLRRYGDERGAIACELHASELSEVLLSIDAEPLTLAEAALESGYTRAHLRRMIRDQPLLNAGTAEEPMILRAHLPRKPGAGVANATTAMSSSRVQVARAVASHGGT